MVDLNPYVNPQLVTYAGAISTQQSHDELDLLPMTVLIWSHGVVHVKRVWLERRSTEYSVNVVTSCCCTEPTRVSMSWEQALTAVRLHQRYWGLTKTVCKEYDLPT